MPRKYPYYPAKDHGKARPGTEKLADLCNRRWKTKNLGIYVSRLMRNSHTVGKTAKDPGMEKWLSVHATGAAVDIGYDDRKVGVEMYDWFLKYTKELGIVEIHDYAFDKNVKDGKPGYGRGFRCSRGEGKAGEKIFTESDNAGSFGGKWLHLELEPAMANDPERFEAAWRALPKPG
jgi:hypothetical protein